MPYPSFSKTGLTTLTFSRGQVFSARRPLTFHQVRQRSQGGVVRTTTVGPVEEGLVLRFEGLPLADYTALRAWVLSPLIAGSAFNFTYTDEAGVVQTVLWWNDTFEMPEVAYQLYDVEITLLIVE